MADQSKAEETTGGAGAAKSAEPHPNADRLMVLRVDLGLTGTKEGCGEGECGACSVLVNGELVNSCLTPVLQVHGASVTTIEGVSGANDTLSAVQQAFIDHGGAQCGICTPGMILTALTLGPAPSLDEVKAALAGNLCRCTGYPAIYRAILKWRQGEPA